MRWQGTSTEAAYEIYQAILMHMTLLRQSFQDVYGDYLPFDFSSIDRVQELHKHMRLLVSTTEDVEEVLRNKSYRLSVWKSMEKRLSFLENLEDLEPEPKGGKGTISRSQQTRIFRHALIEGSGLLREVFNDLDVPVVCRISIQNAPPESKGWRFRRSPTCSQRAAASCREFVLGGIH